MRANSMKTRPVRSGYTLVEILTATLLGVTLLMGVVQVFGTMGRSITDSRAMLETQAQLRSTANRLRLDLEGATASMRPPLRPEAGEGYFEIIEGPVTAFRPVSAAWPHVPSQDPSAPNVARDENFNYDTTAGDFDDVLMFTTRNRVEPFVGRFGVKRAPTGSETPMGTDGNGPFMVDVAAVESSEAEVCWFVRGRTLHRRTMLVLPRLDQMDADLRVAGIQPFGAAQFYGYNDISVRADRNGNSLYLAANTLADLTKRECRFAHAYRLPGGDDVFPYDVRRWGQLRLPTLRECSSPNWVAGMVPPTSPTRWVGLDLWAMPQVVRIDDAGNRADLWPAAQVNPRTLTMTAYDNNLRVAEDVILENVIGFDVRVWDPDAPVTVDTGTGEVFQPGDWGYGMGGQQQVSLGAYVDLGYMPADTDPNAPTPSTVFSRMGDPRSKVGGTNPLLQSRVYDTWSAHYENDGVRENSLNMASGNPLPGDAMVNGFDDDGNGLVDDDAEADAPPPYPAPLKGIQVKIRVFEPDSKQVREVTIVHEFLK